MTIQRSIYEPTFVRDFRCIFNRKIFLERHSTISIVLIRSTDRTFFYGTSKCPARNVVSERNRPILFSTKSWQYRQGSFERVFHLGREFRRARNSSAKGWQTCTTIKPSDLRPTLYGPEPDGPASRIFRRFSVDIARANETPSPSSGSPPSIGIFSIAIDRPDVEISKIEPRPGRGFWHGRYACIVSLRARLENYGKICFITHVRNVYGWMPDGSCSFSFRSPLLTSLYGGFD